jgi:predicted deacylase
MWAIRQRGILAKLLGEWVLLTVVALVLKPDSMSGRLREWSSAQQGISPLTLKLADHQPELLGHSTYGRRIEAYRFGRGPLRVAFIGGIHGGNEWNTILLAYAAIDYFTEHPQEVPSAITLYIVPSANPDGQAIVVGRSGRFSPEQATTPTDRGRFNLNRVDLNRNWDCNWQANGVWGRQQVSGGEQPFSEVENQVLRKFLTQPPMEGVVFWHSAAPGVYPGGCNMRFAPSDALALTYASAAGYPYQQSFTSYRVTGDATDWLSLHSIPAITVELRNHTEIDWTQNLRGMQAILEHLAADAANASTQPPPDQE